MGSASPWEPFRIFPLLFQPPTHSAENRPELPKKMPPQRSHGLSLTLHLPRRFFESGFEGRMRQICLRRHHPKEVSAGAAGNQLLPKPALEAQGNKSQLLWPTAVHSLQAPVASPFSETTHLPILPS